MAEKETYAPLLDRAAAEIRELRRRNEVLAAKVEVMDLFALVLKTTPNYPREGAGVDVAWELERLAGDMRAVKADGNGQ